MAMSPEKKKEWTKRRNNERRTLKRISLDWEPMERYLWVNCAHLMNDNVDDTVWHSRRFSGVQIGKQSGVTASTISNCRTRGTVTLDTAEKICAWLNIHPMAIWGDEYFAYIEHMLTDEEDAA